MDNGNWLRLGGLVLRLGPGHGRVRQWGAANLSRLLLSLLPRDPAWPLGPRRGRRGALTSVAFAGGVVFAALTSAGFAAEVLYPAAAMRFGAFEPDRAFVYVSLALSTWLYHFCQVGTSAMVTAASLVSLGTGALPRWLALGGRRGACDALALPGAAPGSARRAVVDRGGLGGHARRRRRPCRGRQAHQVRSALRGGPGARRTGR